MAVLVTLAMPVLIGALALTTDVGVTYYNWQSLQQAADAGALAGAGYLPSNSYTPSNSACSGYTTGPEEAACDYAMNNGIKSTEISSITVGQNSSGVNNTVSVTLARSVPALFGRVLGTSSYNVGAKATAGIEPASSVTGVLPIGLQYDTPYTYGENLAMRSDQVGPGNWGSLSLSGNGANAYRNDLENGYQSQLNIGDSVLTSPGAMDGPTDQGIEARISAAQAQYPDATWQNHTPDDPRAAVIPLVDWTGTQGRSSVTIKGFAMVWISAANGPEIDGFFIGGATPGSKDSSSAPVEGAYHVALLQ